MIASPSEGVCNPAFRVAPDGGTSQAFSVALLFRSIKRSFIHGNTPSTSMRVLIFLADALIENVLFFPGDLPPDPRDLSLWAPRKVVKARPNETGPDGTGPSPFRVASNGARVASLRCPIFCAMCSF